MVPPYGSDERSKKGEPWELKEVRYSWTQVSLALQPQGHSCELNFHSEEEERRRVRRRIRRTRRWSTEGT